MKNLILVAIVLFFSSCATLVQGSKQDFRIQTVPEGAAVFVNGEKVGETPIIAQLKRSKQNQNITLRLEGYYPYILDLQRDLAGHTWINLVLGYYGLPLIVVDVITGSIYMQNALPVLHYNLNSFIKIKRNYSINVELKPIEND